MATRPFFRQPGNVSANGLRTGVLGPLDSISVAQ